MGRFFAVISCLLLAVGAVTAQTAASVQRALPQWLTGIIAVAAFLFLVFIALLVNKAWCGGPRKSSRAKTGKEDDYVMTNSSACESSLDMVRSPEDRNAYENQTLDITDDKVTAM